MVGKSTGLGASSSLAPGSGFLTTPPSLVWKTDFPSRLSISGLGAQFFLIQFSFFPPSISTFFFHSTFEFLKGEYFHN
jgi:hypothetical protein